MEVSAVVVAATTASVVVGVLLLVELDLVLKVLNRRARGCCERYLTWVD